MASKKDIDPFSNTCFNTIMHHIGAEKEHLNTEYGYHPC